MARSLWAGDQLGAEDAPGPTPSHDVSAEGEEAGRLECVASCEGRSRLHRRQEGNRDGRTSWTSPADPDEPEWYEAAGVETLVPKKPQGVRRDCRD